MEKLSHRERIQAVVEGVKPDRFAASLWRHFFHLEHTADGTVESLLQFQKQYDWDFMKLNTRADYHIEDWGFEQEFSHDEFTKHKKTRFPITSAEGWTKLKVNPPTAPALAEHLSVVSRIRKQSDPELPILMTMFNPIGIAGRMVANREIFRDMIRSNPNEVKQGLRTITDTFKTYVSELRNAGADGLFFATLQWASSDLITWEEYQEFGLPYDLEVMQAAESDALNLLHVCAGNNYLEQLAAIDDYNASLYNWDTNDPTNLPIDVAMEKLPGKALVGGIDHEGWLRRCEPDEVKHLVREAREKLDSSRVILGPGCVVPPEAPTENLQALRDNLHG